MDPYTMSPEEQQQIMAAALRSQAGLAAASQRGGQFDTMAAITQLINNPNAAKAAGLAASQAQTANKPLALGNQGFAVPSTGEFLASPMFMQDKMEGRVQQRGLQQDRLLQAAQLAQERLAQQQQLQTMMEQGRNDRAAQANALRQTLATMSENGRNERAAAKADEKPKGKALPWSGVNEISKKLDAASAYGGFVDTFKPEYAGVVGSSTASKLQNTIGRMAPDMLTTKGLQEQAAWWQNYNAEANKLRNQLFGSALTKTEEAAFNAANIEPGMNDKMITTRLKAQRAAAERAARKLVQNAGAAGYDVSGFEGVLPNTEELPAATGGGGGAPAGVDPKLWSKMTPEERALWK